VQGKDNQYYLAYTLRIEKILRSSGKLKNGTVELVTELPVYWRVTESNGELVTIGIQPSHKVPGEKSKLEFHKGSKGIFFCDELGEYPSFKASTENFSIRSYCPYSDCYINLHKTESDVNFETKKVITKTIAVGLNKTFNSVEEVYEYLSKFKNIVIEKEPDNKDLKKDADKKKDASGSLNVISKENQIKYAQEYRFKLVSKIGNYLHTL